MTRLSALLALSALACVATGCDHKEASSTEDAATVASAMPSSSAGARPGMPALSASALASATPPPAATVAHAIPSQADESMAAVKDIDKTNYKKELSAIEADLQ